MEWINRIRITENRRSRHWETAVIPRSGRERRSLHAMEGEVLHFKARLRRYLWWFLEAMTCGTPVV